jgi:hypothetical protein
MASLEMDAGPITEADGSARSAVKSLRKALSVLNAVAAADRPLTVAEVARHAGIARPTAYRFVQTLVVEGSLAQDATDGRLSIGFAVLPLAALCSTATGRGSRRCRISHAGAVSGERANLGIPYRDLSLHRRRGVAGAADHLFQVRQDCSRPLLLARKGDTRPSA